MPQRFEGVAMSIAYCIQIADPIKDQSRVQNIISESFDEIDRIYNDWNPHSEISQLNHVAAGIKVALSPQLAAFLDFTHKMVCLTEGRFDPTVAPLVNVWKKNLQEERLPSYDEIAEAAQASGWSHIHLENGYFWKDHSLSSINLGGIAKGFAVDLIFQRLFDAGYHNLYVEWGGEIRTCGRHPEGRPWKIGIIGLFPVELRDASIATSGSYHQKWTVEGISYTHIIDPASCAPIHSGISSATVIASSCAEADALATALLLFPSIKEAKSWADKKKIQVFVW